MPSLRVIVEAHTSPFDPLSNTINVPSAMVNRQLHAALAELQPSKAQLKARAASVPPPTPHETDLSTMSTPGTQPHLTRRSDGLVFLVDGDGRRKVKSGLLAAALEVEFGPVQTEGESGYGRAGDAASLEVLAGPSGEPFLVVGGKRHPLRGLPSPRTVDAAEVARFPEGKTIDVARANVARAKAAPPSSADLGSQVKRVLRGLKRKISK